MPGSVKFKLIMLLFGCKVPSFLEAHASQGVVLSVTESEGLSEGLCEGLSEGLSRFL